MKVFFTLVLTGLFFVSCTDSSIEDASNGTSDSINNNNSVDDENNIVTNSTDSAEQVSQNNYSYKVLLNDTGNEWGYQLFQGSKMIIKQMHIPAVQGNYGFETKEKAEIAAEFVLNKLENNIFPPAISPEELDSLGVLPEMKEVN